MSELSIPPLRQAKAARGGGDTHSSRVNTLTLPPHPVRTNYTFTTLGAIHSLCPRPLAPLATPSLKHPTTPLFGRIGRRA